MRIAIFIPCFIDQLYPQVGIAMVKVLRRLGINPEFPSDQTCCGQPAFNTGYWDEARTLAKRYCEIFTGYDAVVCPSGSCAAMVRIFYPELLRRSALPGATGRGDDSSLATDCLDHNHVCSNTFEFSEFLVKKLGKTDLGARFPGKVTYHDGCHGLRELRLKAEPRQLLANVRDLQLIEMDQAETCCGFGGTFSVKFPMISYAMDEVKVESIKRTGADYVVSADSSCLMQIDGYLKRHKIPVKPLHLAEVLASE